jgi:predicted nucleic acid-binding protein
MPIVIDTSAIIAVVANEQSRSRIIALTKDQELLSPPTLRWEVVNAFSAMFKRRQVDLTQAAQALDLFEKVPVRLLDLPLAQVLQTASSLNIYAYDACMIVCAKLASAPLLTLDGGLIDAARRAGVSTLEVSP